MNMLRQNDCWLLTLIEWHNWNRIANKWRIMREFLLECATWSILYCIWAYRWRRSLTANWMMAIPKKDGASVDWSADSVDWRADSVDWWIKRKMQCYSSDSRLEWFNTRTSVVDFVVCVGVWTWMQSISIFTKKSIELATSSAYCLILLYSHARKSSHCKDGCVQWMAPGFKKPKHEWHKHVRRHSSYHCLMKREIMPRNANHQLNKSSIVNSNSMHIVQASRITVQQRKKLLRMVV